MSSRLVTINDDTIDFGRLAGDVYANQANHQEDRGHYSSDKPGLPSTDGNFTLRLNPSIHIRYPLRANYFAPLTVKFPKIRMVVNTWSTNERDEE